MPRSGSKFFHIEAKLMTKERQTVSLGIPSSCVGKGAARSHQQATHILHQIARAALLFDIDEIVVYDVPEEAQDEAGAIVQDAPKKKTFADDEPENKKTSKPKSEFSERAMTAAAVLQYFVTPSYLEKALFSDRKKFQYAKKLPKLPGLPFMNHSKSKYLEGLTVPGKVEKSKGRRKSKKQILQETTTEFVNIGEDEPLKLSHRVPVGARVTVDKESKKVVSPLQAYESGKFGYTVRIASTFEKVFTESPHASGYTYTAYVPSEEFTGASSESEKITAASAISILASAGAHVLLVFGKWADVASAINSAKEQLGGLDDPTMLFDGRLNVSHGFRTEDVITVALARIKD